MDLNATFERLNLFNWKIKISKCQFAKEEVNYLGHTVGKGNIKPLERNLDKLKQMKRPAKPEDIVALLGLTGYYKKFIQGYDYLV